MSYFALDPQSFLEPISVHIGSAAIGPGTFNLATTERIDIGKFEFVLVAVADGGGSGTIDVTPEESDSQTGSLTPLDGTNGNPDFRISFAASEFELKHKIIRTAGRRQYLNFKVVIGTAAARPCIILYGIRRIQASGPDIEADLVPLQVA